MQKPVFSVFHGLEVVVSRSFAVLVEAEKADEGKNGLGMTEVKGSARNQIRTQICQ